jgi:hypothetical protein
MIVRRKPLVAALAGLVLLLGFGTLVQHAVAASSRPVTAATAGPTSPGGQAPFAPCPANWYPLEKQPAAIQEECAQLKTKALLDQRATAQARPWRPSTPPTPDPRFNFTPGPAQGAIPSDWLTTTAVDPNDPFQSYSNHWPGITSAWQVGGLQTPGQPGFGRVVVYAAGPYVGQPDGPDNPRPLIDRRVFGWANFQYGSIPRDSVWVSPRTVGAITITGITGPTGVVSFTAASGVSGTLNMATGAWTFNQ